MCILYISRTMYGKMEECFSCFPKGRITSNENLRTLPYISEDYVNFSFVQFLSLHTSLLCSTYTHKYIMP